MDILKSLSNNWTEKKVLLKNRYPQLTEEDLTYRSGEQEKLIERISRRLDTSQEETRHILRRL